MADRSTNRFDVFIPRDPQTAHVRPLDKGMHRHVPGQLIPAGGFYTVRNLIAGPEGLRLRPALRNYFTGTLDYPPAQEIQVFRKTDESSILVGVDQKFLYELTSGTFTGKYWTYTDGDASEAGTTVTGSGTAWDTAANEIRVGDVFVFDPEGSGDGPEEKVITAINSDTELEVESDWTEDFSDPGQDYEIRRAFGAIDPYLVDSVSFLNRIVFADGVRWLYNYDGSTFGDQASAVAYAPRTVTFWNDRLFVANMSDSGNWEVQRVRWSDAGAYTTWDSASYYDLPYSTGVIEKILPLSEWLVVYATDAIYIGTPTNRSDLPLVFRKLDTGGIGLVGLKAVANFHSSHFFVGQDNIYILDNRGVHEIGTPVVQDTIRACTNIWRIYAGVDTEHDRIVFGFPETGTSMVKLWGYNYKSRAWSYDELTVEAFKSIPYKVSGETWDSQSATWDDTSASWDSFGLTSAVESKIHAFVGDNTNLHRYENFTQDYEGSTLDVTIETGDLDFGLPDMNKTVTRVSVKLKDTVASDLNFDVSVSHDGGTTYKQLTNANQKLSITAGKLEGFWTFRTTGSAPRFKITGSTSVAEYVITELTFRFYGRGKEYLR